MLLDILKKFNWIDFLVIIILFRTCSIAFKNGLVIEFFKTLGTVSAIYLSLHYYTRLSDFLIKRFGLSSIPLMFFDFILFMFLVILTYLIFVGLREVFSKFIQMEAVPQLNQWGGFILGLTRGFFLVGLVVFALVISNTSYLEKSVSDSYLGKRLIEVAPTTYSALWNGFFSKFMTKESFNDAVLEAKSPDSLQQ